MGYGMCICTPAGTEDGRRLILNVGVGEAGAVYADAASLSASLRALWLARARAFCKSRIRRDRWGDCVCAPGTRPGK